MKNLLGFVEQRKKMDTEAPTVQVGTTPTELTATPPYKLPKFYRPDALSAAQLHGSRLLIYICRSWPPYLAVVPLSTTWGRGW